MYIFKFNRYCQIALQSCASLCSCYPCGVLSFFLFFNQNSVLYWWAGTWALALDLRKFDPTPSMSCAILGRLLILYTCLRFLTCQKGIVRISRARYRHVLRIRSFHSCEPLWTLLCLIEGQFKNNIRYYYWLNVYFFPGRWVGNGVCKAVLIYIPVLLVRLSIFSYVYWLFKFPFFIVLDCFFFLWTVVLCMFS